MLLFPCLQAFSPGVIQIVTDIGSARWKKYNVRGGGGGGWGQGGLHYEIGFYGVIQIIPKWDEAEIFMLL